MANTASPHSLSPARRRARVWRVLLALVALAIAAAIAFGWTPVHRYARVGAAYGARVACSCRYLGGRSLGDCHKDMERAVAWVSLSEDPATQSVTASYPLLAQETATYRQGWGCQLPPWTPGH